MDKVGENVFSFIKHLMQNKAALLYYSSILIQEFQQTVNGSMYILYITYVSKEDKVGTALYSQLVGVFGLISQVVWGFFLKKRFANGDSPAKYVIFFKLVYAVFVPITAVIMGDTSANMFVINYIIERLAFAPQTYERRAKRAIGGDIRSA